MDPPGQAPRDRPQLHRPTRVKVAAIIILFWAPYLHQEKNLLGNAKVDKFPEQICSEVDGHCVTVSVCHSDHQPQRTNARSENVEV